MCLLDYLSPYNVDFCVSFHVFCICVFADIRVLFQSGQFGESTCSHYTSPTSID